MKYVVRILICLVMLLNAGCATRELTPIFRPVDIGYQGTARTHTDNVTSSLNSVNLPEVINKGSVTLDDAFRAFRGRCTTGDACRYERNSIQDRLIAASNSICVEYKTNLKQAQANTNLNFGGASTILGGLGAIAQSADPARLYSGAAAMASGLRAEVNQNIYAMLAVEVITKAIDKTRGEVIREISVNQASVLTNYTLERAISDVVEYHGRCTILAGLQEAATAVSQSEDIGVRTLGRTLADLGQTTSVQLGKKQYSIGGVDTILMKNVCTTSKQEYDAYLRDKKIDKTKNDFKGLDEIWSKIFADSNYCKDLDGDNDVAKKFDQRWQDLVIEFSSQTDEKERGRVVGQIAGQQAGAKAVSNTLLAALETAKSNMQAALGRIDAATVAVQKVKASERATALTDAPSQGELDLQKKKLQQVGAAVAEALDRIHLTKSSLSNSDKSVATALVQAVEKVQGNSDVLGIGAAIALQEAAINAVMNWVPQ